MAKDYLNPFCVYGSSHQEDNFTRAWLSTLQALAPAHARLFLRDVLLEKRPDLQGQIDFSAPDSLKFDFQVSESVDGGGNLSRADGALITVDASGDDELSFTSTSPTGRTRPDGLIIDPGSGVTVVIEVKLFGGQQASQVARHHAAFFDTDKTEPDDVWTSVQWTMIADFLDHLRDRGTSEHEQYMLTNFVEYAESLGLAPFRGFRDEHFENQDGTTLRKYMRAVDSALREQGVETVWSPDRPKYLGFPNRRDNIWMDYSQADAFRFGIVSGADSKQTCKALQSLVRDQPEALQSFAANLAGHVQEIRSEFTVRFRPHLRFFYSPFSHHKWYLHCRGRGYEMPGQFKEFREHVLDPKRNPLKKLSRSEATKLFDDLLEARGKGRGPDDLFPPLTDADPVLVHLYMNFELYLPVEILCQMGRDEAVELGAQTCAFLYRKMADLEHIC